uniref:Uncharacterized protein n=1 Tax=Denticeps clupeoides TaxID=299321 RepID=A0AAY4CI96_9TELE
VVPWRFRTRTRNPRWEKSLLEQLQLEQRLMEEENKRKKAFLTRPLSKQTQAEAVKLSASRRSCRFWTTRCPATSTSCAG